jgi:DUF1365 family protein
MESCLYTGQVGHQRLTPVANAFCYSLFFMYLDLAELEQVFAGLINVNYISRSTTIRIPV